MILITPEEIEWDSTDRDALIAFLATQTGARVLDILATFEPSFASGENPNKALVAAGKVEGYHEAVDCLISLKTKKPIKQPTVPSEYPDLEDDSAWINTGSQPNPS